MNYTKQMIEITYEIRRRVPSQLKPDIKMANPDLLNYLCKYYHENTDAILSALIKELVFLAGKPWQDKLRQPEIKTPKQVTKVYRGQTLLEDAPGSKTPSDSPAPKPKAQRIYRGRVIAD